MKRAIAISLCALFLMTLGVTFSAAQESVADAARQARAKKKPAAQKVYTNDDIPSVEIPATQKTPADTSTESSPDAKAEKSGQDDAAKQEQSARKTAEKYKKDIADLKTKIAGLEHDIDLMQREHQVRVSVYYADAGAQLRDSKKWFEDEKKYNDDLAAKQKELEKAKQDLDDMTETARKAGVPLREIE